MDELPPQDIIPRVLRAPPSYVVHFRPDAALLREIAEVVSGLDVSGISEPPRATLTVDELLFGMLIAFENAVAAGMPGCRVHGHPPERVTGGAPLLQVVRTHGRGPVPAEIVAAADATFARVRSEILGVLRSYRASRDDHSAS